MAVSDYSTTAASNTSISGINIAEGMAPSDVNNAMRQMMADIASWRATFDTTGNTTLGDASGDSVTINGTAVSAPNGLNLTGVLGIGGAASAIYPLAVHHASDSRMGLYVGGTLRGIVQATATTLNLGTSGAGTNLTLSTNGSIGAALDGSGRITIGPAVPVTSYHRIGDNRLSENDVYMDFYNIQGTYSACYWQLGAGAYGSSANTVLTMRRNSVTSRSINAGGTINASGADYAEYMTKADGCGDIAKGAIVGVNADGMLTDNFAEAHSFVIKSTDPAYVGGDTWGALERPADDASDDEKAAFESALEAARQRVDRIAFSGQVPVNVTGALPGQYIDAAAGPDGSIIGVVTTAQGPSTVGKVWKVLPDGRAWVKVL